MEDEEAKRACKRLGHQGKCKRARGAAQRTAIDASASLRSLAQSIWGDPPSRAGPRSPCPFGRSRLSVGEAAWTGDLLGS